MENDFIWLQFTFMTTRSILSAFTYVDGCLLLVSGQHPDLDVGPHQSGDGLWYAGLQAVLYRRGAQQH